MVSLIFILIMDFLSRLKPASVAHHVRRVTSRFRFIARGLDVMLIGRKRSSIYGFRSLTFWVSQRSLKIYHVAIIWVNQVVLTSDPGRPHLLLQETWLLSEVFLLNRAFSFDLDSSCFSSRHLMFIKNRHRQNSDLLSLVILNFQSLLRSRLWCNLFELVDSLWKWPDPLDF